MSERWPADDAHVHGAVERLRRGGLVVFPTDTLYGVGAMASSTDAVARLYTVKGRPRGQPMVLLVSSVAQVERLAESDDRARALMQRYWPGPLTIVLRRAERATLPAAIGATLAFRAPNHPIAMALLRGVGEALASSSANRAGEPAPRDADAAVAAIGDGVDVVLDDGPVKIGRASTIIDVSGPELRILREGAVPAAELLRA